MIYRDKGPKPQSLELEEPQSAGYKEKIKAIDYYRNSPKKSFPFQVYKNDDVKDSLETSFYKKCAYCESNYSSVHPVDIEHFRPKGRVKNKKGTLFPAYWWLAYEWDNLLPSCIDCNRERTHKFNKKNNYDKKEHKLGKSEYFPLYNFTPLEITFRQEVTEIPLLINPAIDNPFDYFIFNIKEEGNDFFSIVKPKPGLDKLDELKARESIEVYGLNRPGLMEARAHQIKLLSMMLKHLLNAILRYQRNDNDLESEREVIEIFDDIHNQFLDSDKANNIYVAACRSYFNFWVYKNKLDDVVSFSLRF